MQEENKKYSILLLTNCISDNCGDQVIEACDISLVSAVMENLGLSKDDYEINSQDACITEQYAITKDEQFLIWPDQLVKESDMVLFGGAPLFNYKYQIFYERTAVTLELAQKYNKPVIFSAVGIDSYDEDDPRCQRLKSTVNLDCVKQITTRDGFEELKKYKVNPKLRIDRVSDPAVFTDQVFRNFIQTPSQDDIAAAEPRKKKIGVFIFRANGFLDNKIDFTREDSIQLWKDLIAELDDRGYDYTLLTSGHFGDEAILDYLICQHGIDENKCLFNVCVPEKLVSAISSFDAVISCRLHPSIISFSLGVPSVGIIWNPKVEQFYHCCGYGDRVFDVSNLSAVDLADKIDEIVDEKVSKNEEYLISVYNYMFEGIQTALNLNLDAKPWKYHELIKHMSPYAGTPDEEKEKKIERKIRRSYELTNSRYDKIQAQSTELRQLKVVTDSYDMFYHSGVKADDLQPVSEWNTLIDGEMNRLESGAVEFSVTEPIRNDDTEFFSPCLFQYNKKFLGWVLRFRIGPTWFWYLKNDSFHEKNGTKEASKNIKIFKPGELIPYIPFAGIKSVVAEARWENRTSSEDKKPHTAVEEKKEVYNLFYHSGKKGKEISPIFRWKKLFDGNMCRIKSGAIECRGVKPVSNDGSETFVKSLYRCKEKFDGWALRFRIGSTWFWYLNDGSYCVQSGYDKKLNKEIKVFHPGDTLPVFPKIGVESVVAEARWVAK